jgi:uncharacterized metal-binding protein
MCHLKGKYHSDAAVSADQARIAALYRVATVAASASSEAIIAYDARSAGLGKGSPSVAIH